MSKLKIRSIIIKLPDLSQFQPNYIHFFSLKKSTYFHTITDKPRGNLCKNQSSILNDNKVSKVSFFSDGHKKGAKERTDV